MCLQFLPLLALGAGAVMQEIGASQSRSAMNAAALAEQERQKKYRQQAEKVYGQSLEQSSPQSVKGQMTLGEQERNALYGKLQAIPTTSSLPTSSTEGAAFSLRDKSANDRANQARAALGAYDQYSLNKAINNLRTEANMSVPLSFARQSQGILPLELQKASHAGDTLSGIGGLISSLGTAYGVSRAFAPQGLSGVGGGGGIGSSGYITPLPPQNVFQFNPLLGQQQLYNGGF